MGVIVNETKRKSLAGEVTLGAGARMARTVEVGLAMKAAGFDWLFIDLEHGPFDLETTQQISIAALSQGITPLVRVADASLGARVLDGGAQGIVLPHVNGAEEARALVRACKFPPEGERSAGGGLAHAGFEAMEPGALLKGVNEETLLVAMIETPEGGEQADAIAAVEGIDVLLIGTNDLSAGMGLVGRHDHPRVNKVYEQVIAACRGRGKIAGMGGSYAPDMIERRIREGMRFILAGSDLTFMNNGARAQARVIRERADKGRR